jgi:hypothetical protein
MKESPNPKSSAAPKLHYLVTLDDMEFHTCATSQSMAISNACYHLAQSENLPIALIRWKVAKGDIYSNVELQENKEGGQPCP